MPFSFQKIRRSLGHLNLKAVQGSKQRACSLHSQVPPNKQPSLPPKSHLVLHNSSDVLPSNKLITSYIRSGDLESALFIFDKMDVKTIVTWNSILAGYAKRPGYMREAQELFDKIPEPDTVSYNTMLACYVHNFNMSKALAFFDQIPRKDAASWNTMITGFAENGQMEKACELFFTMPTKNVVTWNAMISGYVNCGDMNSAVKLFGKAPIKSVVAWTSMITGYMKLKKIEFAERLFQEMPMKNLITWNAMISGYIEACRAEDGVKLFKAMLQFGIRLNSSSLSSVLLACSELSALQLGRQVHQLVCKSTLSMDTTASTSLVSMYCKCGNLEDAWKLFLETPRKDVVTWNTMISGFAQHGEGKKALSLFDKMKEEGIKLDWITFVAVLSACNHTGLVDFGIQYFYSMERDFGVELKPNHYACMIDLLGRAGKLVEAVDLINKMPFKPHAAVFGTLLGACRRHKNIEIAEFAAKNLLDLDQKSVTAYVQLANVYATMQSWDQVIKIRQQMKNRKILKTPGYSWIEIRNAVHEFRSGDRIHPELASIHKKLSDLELKMKREGYVPDLEFALHNVDDEQKEQLLLRHSEKLAIAYGLLNLPLGSPIRVFKNLRVCGDCHTATKFISAIERREIIVRDTSRFHHFKDGLCSCGDYW